MSNSNHKVMARICWIPASEGGREHPPLGPRYSTVARFEQEAEKWPKEAWSIVAEFTEESADPSCVEAELWLLTKDAPSHLLQPGSKFELYEGHRMVARGEVLSASVKPSSEIIRSDLAVEMIETP